MTQSARSGLSRAEAERRLVEHGPNEIQRDRSRSLWTIARGTLREPMFLLLLGASTLYLLLGDLAEGLFLTAGALLAVGLVIFQEARSERALRALRQLAEPFAHVIRDGAEHKIPAREIAPGDLLLVGEGVRLPADALLIEGDVLNVDESALTGESAPVSKAPQPEAELERSLRPGDEGGGALYAGTLVVRGHGSAIVLQTGAATAIGRIGASLANLAEEPTPLQRTASRLVGLLGVLALAFCGLVVVAYGLIRHDWIEGALAGITVAISLIPEEFPMVLAVFLALGAWRLAGRKVLVRRAAAIEALGGATLLCVDKTGTLTEGRMEVAGLWTEGTVHTLAPGAAPPPEAAGLIEAAAMASPARSIDPMDRAIAELAAQLQPPGGERDETPIRSWPLTPARSAVIQLWRRPDGEVAAAKGAPEAIFRLCRLSSERTGELHVAVDGFAARGLRVLAVARCRQTPFPNGPEAATFRLEGLIGFLDPLRADVPAALEEARRAGIQTAMITGDYPATALEIARQAGIDTSCGALTGAEIAAATPERLSQVRVFARIQPEQKLALVQAFKSAGEVVVMTGDGVNDAPALEAAHIGVAMGERGTDVAREAADLVLLDDSFASIVGGVRLGRRVFANLRKALTYVTAIHVPIAGLALAPVLVGLPPLLYPMHVVLLELVIDPVCSLVFEAEPSEADAMKRPPRRPDETLFGARQLWLAIVQGLGVLAAVLGLYIWALGVGSPAEARGAAFAALVLANLVLALSDASVGARLFDRRRVVFWLIALAASVVVGAVLYLPAVSEVFRVAAPGPELLAAALATALAAGGWFGVFSALRRRRA
jgi:P-type Ca2+ transporter type 2C